jgi:phosphoenolpyruvate carboxykinase (ATP)
MSIAYTRAIVSAALSGELDDVETFEDPIFGLHIPRHVPDIPDDVLNPRNTWSNPASYDAKATELAQRFQQNFDKYADKAGADLRAAGPKGG